MKRITRIAAFAAILLSAVSAAQAAVISYQSALAPEQAGATGSGLVTLDYDNLGHTLAISASWSGLSATTTVAHIHCCTATPGSGTVGVAVTPGTLPGFPVGVMAGSYNIVLDLTDPTHFASTFINNFAGGVGADAESALIVAMDGGRAYFNIHTTAFPAGEIRGFLQRAPVPEPATLALAGLGLGALAWSRRGARPAKR